MHGGTGSEGLGTQFLGSVSWCALGGRNDVINDVLLKGFEVVELLLFKRILVLKPALLALLSSGVVLENEPDLFQRPRPSVLLLRAVHFFRFASRQELLSNVLRLVDHVLI